MAAHGDRTWAGLAIGFRDRIWLDYVTGWRPVFMVVFVLLGLVAGIKPRCGRRMRWRNRASRRRQG